MQIRPTAAPSPKFTPTQVSINRQDPSVMPSETVTIGVSRGDKPASNDYAVADSVRPDSAGQYLLDPKTDPKGFASMSVLGNLQTGLDAFLAYCDQDKTPSTWWKGGPTQLDIYAYDRKDEPNAFFNPFPFKDRGKIVPPGTHFGVFADPKTNETIYAAHSGEVTGHEGGPGHATLHRFRPNYIRSMNSEVRAYHEAFGDVSAMLTQLKAPSVLDRVVEQTGGDLSKHSIVSDLGEQFGKGINHYIEDKGGPKNSTGGDFVRTAINDLKWQDPDTLPPRPIPGRLSSEAHDFSRVWTGAVYSILSQAVKDRMAAGADARSAIAAANEDLLKITGKLTSNTSPEGDFSFADMARSMIKADEMVGTNLGGLIRTEMARRDILPTAAGLVEREIPSGSHDLEVNFHGREQAFAGTQLANLGGFTAVVPLSGEKSTRLTPEDTSKAEGDLARNLGRLARQDKILFTTPDQKPENISPFDQEGEPYVAMVTWQDGKARLEPVTILG